MKKLLSKAALQKSMHSFLSIAVPVLLLMLGSCSGNSSKPASLQKVSQMPPELAKGKKYIPIDPALLATGKDLVCNMSVKNKMADTAMYRNKVYGFCGAGCKAAFVAEPLTYINSVN